MMPDSLQRGPGVSAYLTQNSTRTYSSKEVCKLVGISYRQLDNWITKGYIEGQGPQGSGTVRVWTPEQLARVREVRDAIDQARQILIDADLHVGLGHPLFGVRS